MKINLEIRKYFDKLLSEYIKQLINDKNMAISEHLNTSTSTSTCMVSKNITITEEAYNYLKSIKGEKSFSETIIEIRDQSKNKSNEFLKYAGCLKDADLKSIEKTREEANNEWQNRS